jgi:hypothetical protein
MLRFVGVPYILLICRIRDGQKQNEYKGFRKCENETNIRKNFAVFCLSRTRRGENFCEHALFLQDLVGFAKIKYSNLKALTKIFTFLRKENLFVFKHLRFCPKCPLVTG